MGRNSGGYTIIEVMIVLAITGILFASAVLVFQGEQGRTSFSQAMQDLNSKIQSYASEISSSTYPGSDAYSCDASGGTPTLKQPPSASPAAQQCIFVGRAFLATPGATTLNGYAVIGSREDSSGEAVTSIDDANPTLAIAPGGGPKTAVLEEDYNLPDNATIKSSKSGGTNYELVGLYNSLQSNSGDSSAAGNNLLLKFYNCQGGPGCSNPNKVTKLYQCIDGQSPSCQSTTNIFNQWVLCIQDGSQTAQVEVDNTSSGLRTKLIFASCS